MLATGLQGRASTLEAWPDFAQCKEGKDPHRCTVWSSETSCQLDGALHHECQWLHDIMALSFHTQKRHSSVEAQSHSFMPPSTFVTQIQRVSPKALHGTLAAMSYGVAVFWHSQDRRQALAHMLDALSGSASHSSPSNEMHIVHGNHVPVHHRMQPGATEAACHL